MIVIGIAGGIGSGKSLVASLLCERGAEAIDADRIGHRVLERPAIKKELIRRWGNAIVGPDGRVDRREAARRAFSSPSALRAFNATVHPPILAEIRRHLTRLANAGTRCVALDAALLLESGLDTLADIVLYVEAPLATRQRRVRENRGWDARELRRREAAQIPLSVKAGRADIVISNRSGPDAARRQIAHLWSAIIEPSFR